MIDVEAPAMPEGFVCPAGSVPGWLNMEGLPTSCVGDLPMLEPPPEPPALESPVAPFEEGELAPPQDVTPEEVQPVTPPRELAETGAVDPLTVLVFGAIVLIAGVATWLTRTKEKEGA